MIKECKVILHNDLVSVVLFDKKEIQVPSNKLIGNTAYVKFDNDKYTVVSKNEFEKFVKRNDRKSKNKEKFEKETVEKIFENSELLYVESQ